MWCCLLACFSAHDSLLAEEFLGAPRERMPNTFLPSFQACPPQAHFVPHCHFATGTKGAPMHPGDPSALLEASGGRFRSVLPPQASKVTSPVSSSLPERFYGWVTSSSLGPCRIATTWLCDAIIQFIPFNSFFTLHALRLT